MPAADPLGFTRSAVRRLAAAVAWLVASGVLLAAIAARGAGHLPAPSAPSAPAGSAPAPASSSGPLATTLTLKLTPTYAVGRWTVEVDGVAQAPDAASAQGWLGRLALRTRTAEVFIHAEAADPLAGGPCALRVLTDDGAAGRRSLVLWGDGSVAARVAPLADGVTGDGR